MRNAGPFLRALQDSLGGWIPFERFMQEALYNPDFGYYSAQVRTVGRRGDFSTFATRDRSLAKAIAAWIQKHNARDVIEVGAGNGELARDILASLGWWRRLNVRYHIVDISAPLREAQHRLLRGHRIVWHDNLQTALQSLGGCAHIFSNELVDAFPCRVFERTEMDWQEMGVHLDGGCLKECWRSCTISESSVFSMPYAPGQRVEVHESYCCWLREWAPHWKNGALLTIDYGDVMPTLYHRRPHGSLRGYAAHQILTGSELLQSPGRCDLTADVNFSDLEIRGTTHGWNTTMHMKLSDFLQPGLSPALQAAAEAFRVIEQCPQESLKG